MAAGCKNTNLLAGLNELFDGHNAIPIFVHFLEEITQGIKNQNQTFVFRFLAVQFSPGRTCPRVRREPHRVHTGRCTSPSCHRWTS